MREAFETMIADMKKTISHMERIEQMPEAKNLSYARGVKNENKWAVECLERMVAKHETGDTGNASDHERDSGTE